MKRSPVAVVALASLFLVPGFALAAELRVEIRQATPTGPGDPLGEVTISDGPSGAIVKTALKGLPPGPHGFHIHENGSCQPTIENGQPVPAGGAGGHLDPQHTGKHEGPAGNGHLGDLPVLQVAGDGSATQTLTAPHIKDVGVLHGKSMVIHIGGDNYSDQPQPLGGGGARIACGVIEWGPFRSARGPSAANNSRIRRVTIVAHELAPADLVSAWWRGRVYAVTTGVILITGRRGTWSRCPPRAFDVGSGTLFRQRL